MFLLTIIDATLRGIVAEEEARQRFKSFLGSGSAYTSQR